MPLEFYDLPNWLFGLLITGTWVVIGVASHVLFRRVCRVDFSDAEKNLSIAMLAVVATVNSLLLAFSAISVWESFGAADKAVRNEAVTLGALFRDLSVYGSPESTKAKQLLRTYAQSVVDEEWPAMQRGEPSDLAWSQFDDMFRAVSRLDPQSPRERALMPEIWARTNELVKQRRERLGTAEAQVPSTLWIVVIVGTLLTIATTYVFPASAFNLTAVGLLSLVFGLVFFFIAAMDRPFAGKESISPEPIQTTLERMDRWLSTPPPVPSR
jgi:hypothetical protein